MVQNKFLIIVPSYNAFKYINDCIMSIRQQSYKNFQCVVIDDCSTDLTYNKANAAIHNDKRFILIRNEKNFGPMFNIINGTNVLLELNKNNDNCIIVTVDGDDKLYDNNVLQYLNEVYNDKSIWMTYGDYKTLSGDPSQNGEIENTRTYRQSRVWKTSHLRSYKPFIWKKIRDDSFRYKNGDYFRIASDLAIMFPLIEMSGKKRIKFINKNLYSYNDLSPLNEFKINMPLLERTREYIWNMPLYEEIK